MTNKPRNEPNGLHILLNCIKKNESRKIMAQLLNISNSAIGKKLRGLEQKGLIEQIISRPVSCYKLTSFGEQMNQFLIQSDNATGFYKCHHKIVGFQIKDYGTFQFNDKLKIKMNGNWHYHSF